MAWTNADLLTTQSIKTNFNEIQSNTIMFIKKMQLKMLSAKLQPCSSDLNENELRVAHIHNLSMEMVQLFKTFPCQLFRHKGPRWFSRSPGIRPHTASVGNHLLRLSTATKELKYIQIGPFTELENLNPYTTGTSLALSSMYRHVSNEWDQKKLIKKHTSKNSVVLFYFLHNTYKKDTP